MSLTKLLAVVVLAGMVAAAGSPAQAGPITINPGLLVGAGTDTKAIFAFVEAAHTSTLVLT